MTTSPTNNMDVKRRNRVNTLRCILKNDRVSQMELTQRLGLSWPTILQNVKELTELGLVREDQGTAHDVLLEACTPPPAGGRPGPLSRCGTLGWPPGWS